MTFGWTPCTCDDSGSTDGTVDCKCGRTSSEMIGMAGYWLDEHIGGIVEDPGYFLQEIV